MPKQLVQFIFTLLFFFTGANALAQNNWQVLPGEIEKSANDPRQYQAITLKNNMTVLLISDKTARKSAAAVSLAIGSMDEPQSQAGLAHYLEHMVLMGSKRFPEPVISVIIWRSTAAAIMPVPAPITLTSILKWKIMR